jgi:hypothetical protein
MSNTTIQLKKSGQSGNTPADLNYGEVAINYADGKLFYKNGVGIKSIENQKTFSTINANNSLIIATTPTDILSLVAGSNITINSNTTTKTVTINSISDDTVAFAAYAQANTAAANTVYLNAVNDLQNTNITSVNTFTQAAYNKANNALANTAGAIFGGDLLIGAGGKLNVLTVGGDEGGEILLGKAVSNTTLDGVGVTIDVYQNKIRFFEQGGSARGFYLDISTGGGGASTNIMSGGGGDDTVAFAAYAQANNASGNTVALQSQMTTTNTNITSVNTFTQAAFNTANTAASNTIYLQTVNDNQNTSISAIDTLATAAYGKANAEGEINNTQNTNITSINTFTQAAYNTANLKFNTSGGTITGNTTIQQNLVVEGDLSVLGNSVTIGTSSLVVEDSLIFLANGNITTDAVDIGVVGQYNPGSGLEHTGIFRDPNLKEWILFQGYTPEILSNTLINFSNPSFRYANLYANVVKSNVISSYIRVNGLDVNNTMTNAWNSANAGVALATAAYVAANTAQATPNVRGISSSGTYYPIFVDSNNAVATAESLYTDGGLSYDPATNFLTAGFFIGPISGTTGSFSSYVQVTGDNDYVAWGANTDTRMMYNGTANTINLQMQFDATSFDIDYFNGVTSANKFRFYRANGDFQIFDGGIVFRDGTKQNTETLTIATAAYAQANNASGNTVALQAVNSTQNTNITSVNTLATAAYGQANAASSVNSTQNTNITSVNTFAQAAYNEANGAVQTGFTTISANAVSITPASNADTLTISAGNNISISACTTTKTITISSTASGGGSSGGFTYNTTPPASGNTAGDRWVDSDDGTLYTYVNDGNSSQWVDFSTSATSSSVGGGAANAILYQAGVGNTTFTSVGTQGQLLMAGVGGVPIWAAQTALRIANTQITGLIASAQLSNTAVTTGTYGGSTAIPVITVDQQGRITGAANANITSGTTITNETASGSTYYPIVTVATSGSISVANVSSTKLTYVPSTGTLSSTIITSTSDEKLKENIVTISNPIDTIKKLRGVEYNWKDNGNKSMGVIAQEVEKVLPYLVSENENGKTVMYQNMIGLLIEAVKEQQKQIDELRGKLDAN